MNHLEQTIREQWADKDSLKELLHPRDVFVGNNSSQRLPWVSITRESGFRKAQSSANRIDATTIRFELYFESYDKGRTLATTLAMQSPNGFHQDAFDIGDDGEDGRVASMILENEGSYQDERGTWVFVVDFVVTYKRP